MSKFILIPPQASNRITASGVHIDAITAHKPVLAPINGTFRENVPVSSQDLLYNSYNLDQCIEKALSLSPEEYLKISNDILELSKKYSLNQTIKNIDYLFRSDK